jgi:hypothetical protein
VQRAFKAPVGAARAAKQSLIFAELVLLVRGQPGGFERAFGKKFGGVLDPLVRRHVRGIVRIVISKNANSFFRLHELRIERE